MIRVVSAALPGLHRLTVHIRVPLPHICEQSEGMACCPVRRQTHPSGRSRQGDELGIALGAPSQRFQMCLNDFGLGHCCRQIHPLWRSSAVRNIWT